MAVPSATITLAIDGTTVTLPSPGPNYEAVHQRAQAIGQTAAGADYVYDKAFSIYELVLPLDHLTATQKNDLDAFYKNKAIGGVNAFTYTDHLGTAHAGCRFLDSRLAFKKTQAGRFSIVLRFRVTSAVD